MSDKALERLLKGFEKFRIENYDLNPERMAELVENGQHPETLVISCSDSRSCPENVFSTDPGDIFVGRHIAALVPPYDPTDEDDTVAASIEYAVTHLGVKHIIVVGHTQCGGIAGLAQDVKDGAVGHWIQRAHEIKELVENKADVTLNEDALTKEMERESVIWSLNNLKTYGCVQKALNDGTLQIHGWQFDMEGGNLLEYDLKTCKFEVILGDKPNNPPANTGSKPPKNYRGPKAI